MCLLNVFAQQVRKIMDNKSCILSFDGGTLVLHHLAKEDPPEGLRYDPRIDAHRAPAYRYRSVVLALRARGIAYLDEARIYEQRQWEHRDVRAPREYQKDAVKQWEEMDCNGMILLPTGSGKTLVAELCIAKIQRDTIVIAPTLALVGQWYDRLRIAFGIDIGILGGGVHELAPITVSTYDSAFIHMERYGNRFGLVVFDEVHHLASRSTIQVAECLLSPYRLGLTATLERTDGRHELLEEVVGPIVYRREITDLSGDFLADYQTECIKVHFSDEERAHYLKFRDVFRNFIVSRGIRLSGPSGWQHFLRESSRSKTGREALNAWRESKRLLDGAEAKLRVLDELIRTYWGRSVIIFTNDNQTAYKISRRFLVPAITHQTDVKERSLWLQKFESGELPMMVTSRVLNEGVDLPSANVAIVCSGSGTVREHVQRLGRILRPQEGKQAILIELVMAQTVEERTSRRRRDHVAYR